MKKILIITAFIILIGIQVNAAGDDIYDRLYLSTEMSFSLKTTAIVTDNDETYIFANEGNLTAKITAYTLPLNSMDKPIKYSSDNPHVTVDENGNVTSDGTITDADITISSGDVSVTHAVHVINKPEHIALSKTEISLYADRPKSETLTVLSDGTNTGAINWYSDDESIVYIDENGNVIPNGVGTTSVYAELYNGQTTLKCTVYVGLYDVKIRSVFITNAIDKIKSGSEYSLSAYIYPDNVQNKTIKWNSSNPTVASIDSNGVVRGGDSGTAVITAEAATGVKDTFELEVVSSDSIDYKYKLISKSVDERIAELQTEPQFINYDYTIDEMTEYQMQLSPVYFSENRTPTRDELHDAIDPKSYASGYGKYQFIDLSHSNGIDSDTLDLYLNGKGILQGKGKAFKEAAERYNISELYLVTHACLESGDGHSKLSNGINVNGITVYNTFGIGAYDVNAVKYGSEYAYQMGWTSIDAAIDGGARWISENYINNTSYRQNTLYKMRWNPDNPGVHQYATDTEWAKTQAKMLKTMFDSFPDAELYYEIPLYKGEKEFSLK